MYEVPKTQKVTAKATDPASTSGHHMTSANVLQDKYHLTGRKGRKKNGTLKQPEKSVKLVFSSVVVLGEAAQSHVARSTEVENRENREILGKRSMRLVFVVLFTMPERKRRWKKNKGICHEARSELFLTRLNLRVREDSGE